MSSKSFSNVTEVQCSWPLHPAETSCAELNMVHLPMLVSEIALNAVLSVVATTGNALWIAAYARTPSFQTPLNMCLLSLAPVGLFNGAVMQPLIISDTVFFLACPSTTCSLEYIVSGIITLVADSTLQNIAVICIDRYIAIIHSIKYNQWVTKTRICIAFGIYALFRLFLSICVFTGIIDYHALVIASIVFSVVIIIFACLRIFLRIRRVSAVAVEPVNPEEERKKAQERKVAKTVGILVGISAFCYAPALGFFFTNKATSVSPRLHTVLWRYIETVMMLNAVMNFSVYLYRHRDQRIAVRKVINDARNAVKNCCCH